MISVLSLLRRGHDHPGFIACATGLTRDRVERKLARLRARGLVSKRRGIESWYLRPPQAAHFSQEKRMAAATKRKAPMKRTNKQQAQTGTRTRQAGAGTKSKTGTKGGAKKRGY